MFTIQAFSRLYYLHTAFNLSNTLPRLSSIISVHGNLKSEHHDLMSLILLVDVMLHMHTLLQRVFSLTPHPYSYGNSSKASHFTLKVLALEIPLPCENIYLFLFLFSLCVCDTNTMFLLLLLLKTHPNGSILLKPLMSNQDISQIVIS